MKSIKYRPERLEITGKDLGFPLLEAGGYHAFDTAIFSERRSTTCFHVTYVATKHTSWEIEGGQTLHLFPGQIGLIQPSSFHRGEFGHDRPNAHFWFYFDPVHPEATLNSPFDRSDLEAAAQVLALSGHTVWKADDYFAMSCQRIYQLLLEPRTRQNLLALRLLMGQVFQSTVETALQARPAHDEIEIQTVLDRIETDLGNWRSVGDIANEFQMEADAFQYFFKQKTGLSPWHYLLHRRCKKACEELKNPYISITQLALELGFSSSQHFSTTFKQLIGVPPKTFRQDPSLHAARQEAAELAAANL